MILATDRLVLRQFVAEDWPAVLAYQADPAYLRYYAWSGRTEADVRAIVARFVEWQAEQPRLKFQLAMTLKESGELIGSCGVRLGEEDAPEAEVGYELAPMQWGNGYATEAAGAMLRFGFEKLGLHRIWGRCVAENVGSQRVLNKLGMQQEGWLREVEWFKGRRWDSLLYGILGTEWASITGGETQGVQRR
jgi:RimJ/RimL family protein N-acetyltransferase